MNTDKTHITKNDIGNKIAQITQMAIIGSVLITVVIGSYKTFSEFDHLTRKFNAEITRLKETQKKYEDFWIDINNLNHDIRRLDDKYSATKDKITSLSEIEKKFMLFRNDYKNSYKVLTNTRGKIETLSNSIETFRQDMSSIENKIIMLEDKVANIRQNISKLEN